MTKPPPFLIGAVLLFWGWQSGLIPVACVMAAVLEGALVFRTRWDLADEEFTRIWTFCSLLLLAAAIYAFTASDAPSDLFNLFQNPTLSNQRRAGTASSRAIATLIRWLPMVFFPFIAAQIYSTREGIPLQTISLLLQRRWKKARKLGLTPPESPSVNIGYAYAVLCVFAASIHPSETTEFFWGFCALLGWGLWGLRSRRYGIATWACCFLVATGLGYAAQAGIRNLQNYLGSLNPRWFSSYTGRGFDPARNRTALGQIGRIQQSGNILIRVETKDGSRFPSLLREATYRRWETRSQTWYAGNARSDFEGVTPETNGTTWVLVPEQTLTASVNIACYLPGGEGLLPLPLGTARLENLPAFLLSRNRGGAVLAVGPGLVIFDALHRSGITFDSPPDDSADQMAVPAREVPALEAVIEKLQLRVPSRQVPSELAVALSRSSPEGQWETLGAPPPRLPNSARPTALPLAQVMRTIHAYFQTNFTYSSWQESPRPSEKSETPLTRFLLKTRHGHCEYFATATVLLLRQLGFPARYAVGYAVHENVGENKFVVRQRDAHAWCLVWRDGLWRDFDTTPGSWFEQERQRASPFQGLSDAWSRLVFEFSKIRYGQTHMRDYLLWGLVPVLGVLLYQILFSKRRRRHRPTAADNSAAPVWPGLDSEFYRLEKTLVERGFSRGPAEPLSAWVVRASADAGLNLPGADLQDLLRLHYRHRFDPLGLSEHDRRRLRQCVETCLERLQPVGQ